MFQVEPIAWLRSLESPTLDWLLQGVSQLGYTPVYAGLIMVLAFGFRLRPSFAVLTTLLLCGLMTEALKSGLALPRPSDLEATPDSPSSWQR